MRSTLLLSLAVAACVDPRHVQTSLVETEQLLEKATAVHARICAPREMATAESAVSFAQVGWRVGNMRRAADHVVFAHTMAERALAVATPCGTSDRDEDSIVDVIDVCPDEPEDFDGDRDEDGCRDLEPYGDEDGDGIRNIDDGCPLEPEDFDGDNDEDGCPESSDDRDGDGIIDAVDECIDAPEDRDGFLDSDGCPDPDNDGDGVLDIHDACAKIPEDLDGWEDEDGCPDPDNDQDGLGDIYDECPNEPGDRMNNGCPVTDRDGDGIADDNDRCPDEPETVNGYLDQDGCPDTPPQRVKVTRTRVEITETILFETGRSALLSASHAVLNDVRQVLIDAPEMRLRVEGHTDDQGGDDLNLRLSNARASAVRDYLIRQGIAAERLRAEGFGETQPLDTNRTQEGRARNRRVEFHILE